MPRDLLEHRSRGEGSGTDVSGDPAGTGAGSRRYHRATQNLPPRSAVAAPRSAFGSNRHPLQERHAPVRGGGAGTAHGLFFWGFFLLRSGRINIERVNMVTATGQPVLVSNLSLLPDDVRRRQQGSRPGGNPGRQRSCRTAGRTPDMTLLPRESSFFRWPPSLRGASVAFFNFRQAGGS
jgi:hypothetical protein